MFSLYKSAYILCVLCIHVRMYVCAYIHACMCVDVFMKLINSK